MSLRRSATSGLAAMVLACSFCGHDEAKEEQLDKVRNIQKEIKTVSEAYQFLDSFWQYQDDPPMKDGFDDWRSLGYNLAHNGGDCDDFAISAGTLLQDDGFDTKIIWILGKKIDGMWPPRLTEISHGVCCLEKENCFYYVDFGYYGENFNSIEELMKEYAYNARVVGGSYSVLDFPKSDWIVDTDENLAQFYSKPVGECKWNSIGNFFAKE